MNLRWSAAAAAIAGAVGMPGASAFSPSPLHATKPISITSSQLSMGPPSDPSLPLTEQYGEGSRKYRRTVYTHEQWVKHRSSDRFVNNLTSITQSGIYKQVGSEVFLTVSLAVSVCVWNALVGGYEDFGGVMHDPVIQHRWAQKVGMPMEAFTIVSSSLGLLLAFRTNQSYKRWDEARKFWGLNINHTRDLNRMATAWYGNQSDFDSTDFIGVKNTKMEPIDPAEREYLLGQVSLMTWAFVRSMKRHLSPPAEDEEDYIKEIKSKLTPKQAEALISATHRPNRALYDLSVAIEQLPMHFVRKNAINNNLSIFEDTLGGSERLLSSPVPLFYSRHTARFLATWLLALPFGLYAPFANSWNHAMMIPATAFISVCLFGIEELATQLEEPFTILPMQGFCDKIGANCDEIVSWAGQGQEVKETVSTKGVEMKTLPGEAPAVETKEAAPQEIGQENYDTDTLFFAQKDAPNDSAGAVVEALEALETSFDGTAVEVEQEESKNEAAWLDEQNKLVEERLAARLMAEENKASSAEEMDEEIRSEEGMALEEDVKESVEPEEDVVEIANSRREGIENRSRRRMSLRERLAQMDTPVQRTHS